MPFPGSCCLWRGGCSSEKTAFTSNIAAMRLRLICTLLTAFTCVTSIAAQTKRPNIVFVLADQWRAQATGYAGDPNVKTPKLDELEAVSVDFAHAVSSNPVCSPC